MTPEQKRILEAGWEKATFARPDLQDVGEYIYAPKNGCKSITKMLDQAQTEIDRYKDCLRVIANTDALFKAQAIAAKALDYET